MMPAVERILAEMRRNPAGIRFADLAKVCRHYVGEPRRRSGSHQVFRTPWHGDPRVDIQDDHGHAKAYQVRQVVAAVDRASGAAPGGPEADPVEEES